MQYVVAIINCMVHHSLYLHTPHKAACGFTPDVYYLMAFRFWEPVFILNDKTQFPEYNEISFYCDGPAPNESALLTVTGFAPSFMVYLPDLSSAMTISLWTLIAIWYQSVGRRRLNSLTLNQYILFHIMKLSMVLVIHFRLFAKRVLLIPSNTSMR